MIIRFTGLYRAARYYRNGLMYAPNWIPISHGNAIVNGGGFACRNSSGADIAYIVSTVGKYAGGVCIRGSMFSYTLKLSEHRVDIIGNNLYYIRDNAIIIIPCVDHSKYIEFTAYD